MAWVTISLRKKELKEKHAYYQLQDLKISRQKRQLARRKQYEESLIQTKEKQALNPIKQAYRERCDALNENKRALNEYLVAVKKIANNQNDQFKGDPAGNYYQKTDNGEYFLEDDGQTMQFHKKTNWIYDSANNKYTDSEGNEYTPETKNNENTVQYWDRIFDSEKYAGLLQQYKLTALSDIKNGDSISAIESQINTELSQISTDLQTAYTEYVGNQETEKEIYENEREMLEEDVSDEETILDEEQIDIETQMEAISQEIEALNQAISSGIQQSTIKLS